MKTPGRDNFRQACWLLGSTLLAGGGAALLMGCKGNTTSAAAPERSIPQPPAVVALSRPEAITSFDQADPLGSMWAYANWWTLTSPANTTRTTAATKGAMLWDTANVYAAFISEKSPGTTTRDAVSFFLDTTPTGDGREMMKVTVDETGQASCAWIRWSTPAQRRADALPDPTHAMNMIPDYQVKGLQARVTTGLDRGVPVWTAVVAIPLKSLPFPLRATPAAGTHWKINLLRNVLRTGPDSEQLQSNLSPVYVGYQELTPYRLSDVELK